jgi:two-component system, cell cycle response regulator
MSVKPTVLIVEDERSILKVLECRLTAAGYHVISATDGCEGLLRAIEGKPDLILLDITLPGMSGTEMKLRLNEYDQTSGIPVVFVTAKTSIEDRIKGFSLGADHYVTKPFDVSELLALIESTLRRRKHYEKIAITDSLTGLTNVYSLKKELAVFFQMARRYQRIFSVMVIDVDSLKHINDTYGHKIGDSVLKTVGQVMKETLRASDILIRYGGDEFVVLMPETTEEQARCVIKRLKNALKHEKINCTQNGKGISFTVSIGVAAYHSDLSNEGELFQLADKRMYEDKSLKKRNFNEVSEPAEPRAKNIVLIIEDDDGIRKSLSHRLQREGYEAMTASDGKQGLSVARQTRPDLIVLDLMLPSLPGEEICKTIREDGDDLLSATPIIMLTAKTSDVDHCIGKVLGANVYIYKPYDVHILLKEINKLTMSPSKSKH